MQCKILDFHGGEDSSLGLLQGEVALQPEDGGSTVLRNVGILSQHHTAIQPRGPRLGLVFKSTVAKGTILCHSVLSRRICWPRFHEQKVFENWSCLIRFGLFGSTFPNYL
jgi:hypothetical protein